jgi:hypothetical protein
MSLADGLEMMRIRTALACDSSSVEALTEMLGELLGSMGTPFVDAAKRSKMQESFI